MAAVDLGIGGGPNTLGSPAANAAVVTPSDTNDLPFVTRSLWVGGAGTVTVNTNGGQTAVLFSGVPAGCILPVRATRVLATGTTALPIVALW